MRIIAGRYRSRPLCSLHGLDIRPTSDRLRETLFNILSAGIPSALEGAVWLDLFAGTGAVGIEALSRGAKQVYFVESSSAATELIRKNLNGLGISSGFRILQQEIPAALWRIEREQVAADIVFIDPPYRLKNAYRETLLALAQSPVIWSTSVVIAEHEKQFDPGETFGPLGRFRKLVQGSAALSFYRRVAAAETRK
jgi:16S rRNA (guanine966-N2)-methyltransferase